MKHRISASRSFMMNTEAPPVGPLNERTSDVVHTTFGRAVRRLGGGLRQRLAGLALPPWRRTGSAPQVLHNFHLFERRLEQHRRIAHGFERGPAAMFGSAARELSGHAISLAKVTCPLVRLPDPFQRFSIALVCFPRLFSPLPETFLRGARAFHFVPLWARDIFLRHVHLPRRVTAVQPSPARRRDAAT